MVFLWMCVALHSSHEKVLKMRGGVTGGVTKWGYIFGKLGLQNSCPRIPCEGGQRAKKWSKV